MKKSYGCSSSKCGNDNPNVRTVVKNTSKSVSKNASKNHANGNIKMNHSVKNNGVVSVDNSDLTLCGWKIIDGVDFYSQMMSEYYDEDLDYAGEEMRDIVSKI